MISHILADGTAVEHITGRMINPDEKPQIYAILAGIIRKEADGNKDNTKQPGRVA